METRRCHRHNQARHHTDTPDVHGAEECAAPDTTADGDVQDEHGADEGVATVATADNEQPIGKLLSKK